METETNKLIAELFSDSINIQILCSIYDNEMSSSAIANLLSIDEENVERHLDILCTQSLVIRKQKDNSALYSLANPEVCNSILSLKDSVEYELRRSDEKND